MDFWNTFTEESLQSPWIIQPLGAKSQQSTIVKTEKVFVVHPDLPEVAHEMLSKMVIALKYKPSDVSVLSLWPQEAESLQDISDSKRILFFGHDFPGSIAETQNWFGHHILKTHSLQSLLAKPELKKETWLHLKTYAGLN